MNPVVIALGVVLLILAYILYKYFTVTSSSLSKYTSLNAATIPPISSIQGASNVSYAYGIWVYVNSWTNQPHVIFSRDNNIKLYLDENTPTLKCDIWAKPSSSPASYVSTTITNNFPLQAWTYVVVSIDNTFLDCYLDGKLVVSNQINGPVQPPDTTSTSIIQSSTTTGVPIYLGNSGQTIKAAFNAYISNFQRWTTAIDPQTVWNSYLSGNGRSQTFSTYGINLDILQNNVLTNQYKIL